MIKFMIPEKLLTLVFKDMNWLQLALRQKGKPTGQKNFDWLY